MHPGLLYAYTRRISAAQGPTETDEQTVVRGFVNIFPQDAPDPIRQSDFVNEGKPWGKGRLRGWFSFGVDRINSVMEDRFGILPIMDSNPHHPSIPKGQMLPLEERQNLEVPAASSYGGLLALNKPTTDYSMIFRRPQ